MTFNTNDKLGYSKELTKAVVMIQTVFDNAKIGDIFRYWQKHNKYNNGKSSNNFKHLKFISFSNNNRLGHAKQLTIAVRMVQSVFNNIDIGNVLRYWQKYNNYNNSNKSSNFKRLKLINFFINNRSDHLE